MALFAPRTLSALALCIAGSPFLGAQGLTPLDETAKAQIQAGHPKRVAALLTRFHEGRANEGWGPETEVREVRSQGDGFGLTHVRVQQLYKGVPVWGGEAILHADASGQLLPRTDRLQRGLALSTEPVLGASEALAVGLKLLAPKGPFAEAPMATLVVLPLERLVKVGPGEGAQDYQRIADGHVLAWHLQMILHNGTEETREAHYMVDARTGALLRQWEGLRTGGVVGTGQSQWYGTVSLNTNNNGSGFELKDMTRGTGGTFGANATTNLNHATSGNGALYTDTDNAWGDGNAYGSGTTNSTTGPTGQTAAVDAHRGLQATWDFYKNVFSRNGIDGLGTATYSRMHYGADYDNAFWSDACFCMTYGDGAPPSGSYGEADLDTAGHEMTHGVTSHTADLVYAGESGGLNESTSDIFGTCVEFYVLGGNSTGSVVPDAVGGGAVTANYTMFENSWGHPGEALRYMYKPSLDGGSADAWFSGLGNLDVHYSSGPMNRAWYFLTKGATTGASDDTYSSYLPTGMTGIGNDKAARIWYRALTTYLTSSSDYVAARGAAVRAATDLYGAVSTEYQAVQNAFAAINVGGPANGQPEDFIAPTVSTPAASGSTGTVNLTTTASDNVVVAQVDYLIDGVLIGSSAAGGSWTLSVDTTKLPPGSHQLTARALDANRNAAVSAPLAWSLSNFESQGILNPGFESGLDGWNPTANAQTSPIVHGGSAAGWLGGFGQANADAIYQTLTVPTGASSASLSFWLRVSTAETGAVAKDTLNVVVRNGAGSLLKTLATYSNLDLLAPAAFAQHSFDLSEFKGQTIRLAFEYTEDAANFTSFRLDDLSLQILSPVHSPDLDASGKVDGIDLGRMAFKFGLSATAEDMDGNGIIDDADLNILLGAFGH